MVSPRDVRAFDTEPNNSILTAESVRLHFIARGSVNSSTDVDDYFTFTGAKGTYEAWITGYAPSGSSNDFDLTLESSTTTLATAADDTAAGYGKYLSYSMSPGSTYYLHVHATTGSGGYRLRTRIVRTPPDVTSTSPTCSGGSTCSAGTSVTLSGTSLGSGASSVEAYIGGIRADVSSASGTSAVLVVPVNAVNGYLLWCTGGGCDTIAFDTGSTTLPTETYEPPDPADLLEDGYGAIYASRIGVSFLGVADSADADAAMASATACVTSNPITSYSEVGFMAPRNTYFYELGWTTSPPVEADYVDLIGCLASEADVDGLLPETPVEDAGTFGFGNDVGFYWNGGTAGALQYRNAGLDLIGAEEAWRLLSTAKPLDALQAVTVVVVDTGLVSTAAGELQTDNLEFVQYNGSTDAWEATTTWADTTASASTSHGTPIASILAPRSGKELSGLHRVYVLVRDPDVLNVQYMIDGASSTDCPTDANLEDGISDTCVLDTSGWTDTDDHLLQVILNYSGTGNSFELRAHY